ncbi:MAG: class I tRNA ligase family protein, partial [Patescibacteria group bacterium]|nr:class I tRNA ligase family protein [Patescibacteria group bacterium]
ILAFWGKNRIFEKTLEKTKEGTPFVFYDGPPFATGLPHYGHFAAGTIKDAIPRYQTMKGRFVRRQWGWDCHGLPVENLIEKELGLEHKKDIETFGVEKFNAEAKKSVLRYDSEWKSQVPRMGRFVDMGTSYKTMDSAYSESIWWAFKELHQKGLVYEGYKSMHICPRCETTLASAEVAQGYKDITDISVTVKFELTDPVRTDGSGEPTSHGASEPGTYVLAWTTTPWTLPGNVALAVGKDIEYAKVQHEGKHYLLAKERIAEIFKNKEHEVIGNITGSDLVGRSYKPVFDYYSKDASLPNHENGWKIYAAPFVTTESGTGIVHIAPAFGEDDMNLGREERLPFVQHVNMDGTFKAEVAEFAGLLVKPKEDPQETDIAIIKYLAHHNTLFAKEKITHSYPHCWRCDTPLLNYATNSWFIEVTKLRDKLVKENKKIAWVPSSVGEARFGNWLAGARDWAISRSRFWGAPLPVWKCDSCGEQEIIGSIDDLRERTGTRITKIILARHGESEKNVKDIFDHSLNTYGLTKKGEKEAKELGSELKHASVDYVYSSEVRRARQTAEIIGKKLGVPVSMAKDLNEMDNGEWDGKRRDDERIREGREAYLALSPEAQYKAPRGDTGESWEEVEARTERFMREILEKHAGKTVVLVTHAGLIGYALRTLNTLSFQETVEIFEKPQVNGYAIPITIHVSNKTKRALDLHRPFIDELTFSCSCGGQMKRVPEVFDCWFESGSMPFAQFHYPFENKKEFEDNFPADFIAEGLDQTRGWFYTLLVLGMGLFGKSPYKNVVVNGTILAEDGQKMSKRLKNYPDPMEVVAKYGADSVRYYVLSSPVMRAEDLRFGEKGVDEIYKKLILRLNNVCTFYETYKSDLKQVPEGKGQKHLESKNVLDRWITERLNQLITEVGDAMDRYELDRATRPIALFIDDLSTWYLRRSRERFKGDDERDKQSALQTTGYTLRTLSKIMAPFLPFLAEDIYQKINGEKESVHLEDWPKEKHVNIALIDEMSEVRRVVSLGLENRAREGFKVRQPLLRLTVKSRALEKKEDLHVLIQDEVNVKEIVFDENIADDVYLDINLTDELKKEGFIRELIRHIQDLRKKTQLTPQDVVVLSVSTSTEGEALVREFDNDIKKAALLHEVNFGDSFPGEEFSINDIPFKLRLER